MIAESFSLSITTVIIQLVSILLFLTVIRQRWPNSLSRKTLWQAANLLAWACGVWIIEYGYLMMFGIVTYADPSTRIERLEDRVLWLLYGPTGVGVIFAAVILLTILFIADVVALKNKAADLWIKLTALLCYCAYFLAGVGEINVLSAWGFGLVAASLCIGLLVSLLLLTIFPKTHQSRALVSGPLCCAGSAMLGLVLGSLGVWSIEYSNTNSMYPIPNYDGNILKALLILVVSLVLVMAMIVTTKLLIAGLQRLRRKTPVHNVL